MFLSVKIDNFKSLVDFSLPLAKFNCLIGLNGAGNVREERQLLKLEGRIGLDDRQREAKDRTLRRIGLVAEKPAMLLDHRTYTCRPGTLRKQLALYQEHGWAAQTEHLGQPFAYLTTETGDVNVYVHIWMYEDAADRATDGDRRRDRRRAGRGRTGGLALRRRGGRAGRAGNGLGHVGLCRGGKEFLRNEIPAEQDRHRQ